METISVIITNTQIENLFNVQKDMGMGVIGLALTVRVPFNLSPSFRPSFHPAIFSSGVRYLNVISG